MASGAAIRHHLRRPRCRSCLVVYVPPRGREELPRFGPRAWTALVVTANLCLTWLSLQLLRFVPKLENTTPSRISLLQDRAELQLALATAALIAALAAHVMAWRGSATLVLPGAALILLGAAILVLRLTF